MGRGFHTGPVPIALVPVPVPVMGDDIACEFIDPFVIIMRLFTAGDSVVLAIPAEIGGVRG